VKFEKGNLIIWGYINWDNIEYACCVTQVKLTCFEGYKENLIGFSD